MKHFGRLLGLATELGLTMGLTAASLVLVGLLIGRWADRQLGTSPLITLVLLIAGAIAGQMAIYRLAIRSSRRLSANESHPAIARDVLSATGFALRILLLLSLPGLVGLVLGIWSRRWLGSSLFVVLIPLLLGLLAGLIGALHFAYSRKVDGNG